MRKKSLAAGLSASPGLCAGADKHVRAALPPWRWRAPRKAGHGLVRVCLARVTETMILPGARHSAGLGGGSALEIISRLP